MRWCIPLFVCTGVAAVAHADPPTEVIVLGVSHSGQLVSEASQPAVLRAFIDRARPAAICIEREPESYARGDFYEFTYEQQEIVVPHARERGIPVWPFDWEPRSDDMKLAFGVSFDEPPLIRATSGYLSFSSFPEPSMLETGLLAAEDPGFDPSSRRWAATPAEKPRRDFARRLFLYRTYLQAMRIAQVAKRYPGRRMLVLVGWMHKPDIEGILGDDPGIRLLPPTKIGAPTSAEVAAAMRTKDLDDILAFNLTGVQASTGNVNWKWMKRVLGELRRQRPRAAQLALFDIRLAVLTGEIDAAAAIARYERAIAAAPAEGSLPWTGRTRSQRLDSYFDPFAGLTVRQRLRLERARELGKAGRASDTTRIRDELAAELTAQQAVQLRAYWDEFVGKSK